MAQLAKKDSETVARPLRVLVPLIQADLRLGSDAAKQAGIPYYRAAGEKLLEAKTQMPHGEFLPWVRRHFHVKPRQLQYYMQLAEVNKRSALRFSSLSDFLRNTTAPNYNKPSPVDAAVREVVGQVDTTTLNLKRAALERDEERDAERRLALQLIDIGYKVLARELHPDKGGSRVAMARLNAVRMRLKNCV